MTGYQGTGMWADPAADPRDTHTTARGEKEVLASYLDHYRLTLELKCEGLTPAQLATRSVPPSITDPTRPASALHPVLRCQPPWWNAIAFS